MENLIAREAIIADFISSVFDDIEVGKAMFVSLSARAKYLNPEERNLYSLNHNEMFHRRWFDPEYRDHLKAGITVPKLPTDVLVERVIDYIQSVRIMGGVYLEDYRDKHGTPLPVSATTVYVNINPSSFRKAAFVLQRDILDMMEKGEGYERIQSKLNTAMQKSRSRRVWTDIDIDADHAPEEIIHFVRKRLPFPVIIKSHSGYHVMVKNELMKLYKVNLGEVVDLMTATFSDHSEIGINKNAMVPLPGTFQGGVEVKLL
jgi:hypothetical protein